jgi:methanesulfonate monooxygenase small subunit
MIKSEQRQAIEELVYRSCLALDGKDYKAFLALCDEDFRYTISTYSPEIRREMVWLDHDRKGMEALFTNLPRHNSDHSPLTRHATQLDGGATELFAVGRFHDTIRLRLDGANPKLARRLVRLETRLLGYGYHIPF